MIKFEVTSDMFELAVLMLAQCKVPYDHGYGYDIHAVEADANHIVITHGEANIKTKMFCFEPAEVTVARRDAAKETKT